MNLNNGIDRMKDTQHTTHDFKFNNKKQDPVALFSNTHIVKVLSKHSTLHPEPGMRKPKFQNLGMPPLQERIKHP